MNLQDADLHEGITYNTAKGESHKSRGVTKRKVSIVLRPSHSDETKVYLHVMVDNATTYDILLGAHWIHRIGGIINSRDSHLYYRPDWNTTGVRESSIPIYAYHPQQLYNPEQAQFQCFQGVDHQPTMVLDRGEVQEF